MANRLLQFKSSVGRPKHAYSGIKFPQRRKGAKTKGASIEFSFAPLWELSSVASEWHSDLEQRAAAVAASPQVKLIHPLPELACERSPIPSPVPRCLVVKNGSQIRSRRSAGTPEPLSCTLITKSPLEDAAINSTSPAVRCRLERVEQQIR